MSCNCTSAYLGRTISPVVGFSFSIFWLMFSSHFGSVTSPVSSLYSIKLYLFRSVSIKCKRSFGISVSLASCLMFFAFCSSRSVIMSATVSIGLNLCSVVLRVWDFLSILLFGFL